jgi:hypothetical protein
MEGSYKAPENNGDKRMPRKKVSEDIIIVMLLIAGAFLLGCGVSVLSFFITRNLPILLLGAILLIIAVLLISSAKKRI